MHRFFQWILAVLQWLPGLDQIRFVKKNEWVFESFSLDMTRKGNVVTLGGIQKQVTNGLLPEEHLIRGRKDFVQTMEKFEHQIEKLSENYPGVHPGIYVFFSHQGLVVSGLVRGVHLVWRHRLHSHFAVGSQGAAG
ncbi:MAG: hypothetical protein U5K27_16405 [Desulfotignum sp.]|nr:hypothetical protein [Desulfotignum sp.]